MQTLSKTPLTEAELERLDRYWRATNYLSVGQIYLLGNPLLEEEARDVLERLCFEFADLLAEPVGNLGIDGSECGCVPIDAKQCRPRLRREISDQVE